MLTPPDCRTKLAVIALVMLPAIIALGANPSNGVLSGRVADFTEHAPINRAFILVHRHGSDSDGDRLHVNSHGLFSAELSSGFYDVFVSSSGFSPVCGQVEVKAGETVVWNAVLKMSELVNAPD